MSDNRKFLIAKRKEQRNIYGGTTFNSVKEYKQDNSSLKRGVKRLIPSTPRKNLANDRLKKLRTSLNEELPNSSNQSQSSVKNSNVSNKSGINPMPSATYSRRKRPPHVNTREISVTKVPRKSLCDSQISNNSPLTKTFKANDSSFKITQKSIFGIQSTTTSHAAFNSIEFNANSTTEEVMEWSPADVEQPSTTLNLTDLNTCNQSNATYSEYFYIVVDTNIFLSHMQMIRNIIEMDNTGIEKPVIFIPWIVIEELDFIKDDSNRNSVKWKAQEAIKYIEKTLTDKNERMIGQTLEEANDQKDTGKGQDNKIISCCLQVLTKRQNMILLTDDINLRNKALINHIPVCSHKEILSKISVTSSNHMKSQIILEKMTYLCKTVIKECALKAYGDACNKMPICQSIPQTMQDCIKIFNKYWFPVFQEVLMKQFKKSIDDLSSFLIKNSNIKDGSKELNDLSRLCVRVCIFLKDVDFCKSVVENTIREINKFKISCFL